MLYPAELPGHIGFADFLCLHYDAFSAFRPLKEQGLRSADIVDVIVDVIEDPASQSLRQGSPAQGARISLSI